MNAIEEEQNWIEKETEELSSLHIQTGKESYVSNVVSCLCRMKWEWSPRQINEHHLIKLDLICLQLFLSYLWYWVVWSFTSKSDLNCYIAPWFELIERMNFSKSPDKDWLSITIYFTGYAGNMGEKAINLAHIKHKKVEKWWRKHPEVLRLKFGDRARIPDPNVVKTR